MKQIIYITVMALSSFIVGCSSTPMQYDDSNSVALNVVTAAGINDRLKDVQVPKDTTWDIRDTAGFNIPAAISAYNTPTPGLTGGQSAGLSIASWLISPESEAKKNHIIAWQPNQPGGANTIDGYAKLIAEAAQKAAKEQGLDTWVKFHNDGKAAYLFLNDTGYEYCTNKEYCMIFGFVLTQPENSSNTPGFVNSTNDSLFYDPRDRNNYTFNKAFMGINEVEFLQLMSKHLPKWSYFYIAPSKLKLDQKTKLEAPAVINDGEVHFFIKKV
tara:strand:+ start:34428 stop:35240 length:813 start_codon:yes stop_codon:yes gene_type:complete